MTKEIKLTQGKVALVDDDRFDELNQFKWFAHYNPGVKSFYAERWKPRNLGKQAVIKMHRFVMDAPSNMEVDHIDHDTLNNQSYNLRICTTIQNNQNKGRHSNNTSGFKGVHFDYGKWRARIMLSGKSIGLGYYNTPEEAARAYDEAAKKYHGEFAKLNFKENQ